MSGVLGDVLLVVAVVAASFSSGWVLGDAPARGIASRKAFTWAALQFVEFPVFFWLYTRIRPRRRLDLPIEDADPRA